MPETEDPATEIADFQQSYHDAKFQRSQPDDDAGGEEKVTLETETKTTPTAEPPAEPAKDDVSTETPAEGAPKTAPDPQVKLYTVPDHEMYGALRGQRVTAAQLEEAGLIGKVITRDHQEMHNTKLYNELKKEFDAKLAQAMATTKPPEPTATPISPKDFSEHIVEAYVPSLKKLADAGSFEPDIIEAYPKFVAHIAHQLETMRMVGAGVVKGLQEVSEWVGMQQSTLAREGGMAALHRAMDQMSSDELYSPLKDTAERDRFISWMSDKDNHQPWKKMDIQKELANPSVLAGAYAAYRAATRGTRDATPPPAPAADARDKARLAAPTGGVPRASRREGEKSEFEQMKEDLLKSRAAAFGRG